MNLVETYDDAKLELLSYFDQEDNFNDDERRMRTIRDYTWMDWKIDDQGTLHIHIGGNEWDPIPGVQLIERDEISLLITDTDGWAIFANDHRWTATTITPEYLIEESKQGNP